MSEFVIDGVVRGRFLEPYVIAEIGVNHEGSLARAKLMIDQVAEAGGHAAKFQSYKADALAAKDSPAYWDVEKEPTKSQRELFRKYDRFGPGEYEVLARQCEIAGVDFLSTPFDLDAVDMLIPLVPAFKIASADILNVPLLRKVAATGKPVIVSTGAANLPEIAFGVATLRQGGAENLSLLHCVLNYPTAQDNAQLGFISTLARVFPDMTIGYSDHVVPDSTLAPLEAAAILGAVIIEKHFTDDKTQLGNDHYHAMDGADLANFMEGLKRLKALIGGPEKDLSLESAARTHARRSIVAAGNIAAGDTLSAHNLVTKRPGSGIGSEHWDDLIGRKAARTISEDTLLGWEQVE